MSTLAVVEDVLRRARIPLSVPEIVTRARGRLPTKAKRPELVVARDRTRKRRPTRASPASTMASSAIVVRARPARGEEPRLRPGKASTHFTPGEGEYIDHS